MCSPCSLMYHHNKLCERFKQFINIKPSESSNSEGFIFTSHIFDKNIVRPIQGLRPKMLE